MRRSNFIATVFELTDTAGVIIARILSIVILNIVVGAPFFAVALAGIYLLSTYWPTDSYYVAAYSVLIYLGNSYLVVQTYFGGIDNEHVISNILGLPNKSFLTLIAKALLWIACGPILFAALAIGIIINLAKRTPPSASSQPSQNTDMQRLEHYLDRDEYISLFFFVGAVFWFTIFVLSISNIKPLSDLFFTNPPAPGSLSDSLVFTLDLVMRGAFFDVMEHFNLRLNDVTMSSNMTFLIFSFSLRLQSAVIAITLIIKLIRDTRIRVAAIGGKDAE